MTHRLGHRIHVLEQGIRVAPQGLDWRDVRPWMLAIGAAPLGVHWLTELAERQLAGLSCKAVMKRLAKLIKGVKTKSKDEQHG